MATKNTRILAAVVALVGCVLALRSCHAAEADDAVKGRSIRELISQYNCAWVKDMRRIYTDDELRAKARALHLPAVVIRMAEECPK